MTSLHVFQHRMIILECNFRGEKIREVREAAQQQSLGIGFR